MRKKLVKKLQCTRLFKSVILVDASEGESGIVQVLEYRKTAQEVQVLMRTACTRAA